MLIAYVDESGNTGQVSRGGSLTYTLGCVLVDADRWPETFDKLIEFRRRVKDRFGVLLRHEVKANHLLRSGGDIRSLRLAPAERAMIYRAHMRILHTIKVRVFAVVIDKRPGRHLGSELFDVAWETLLQRLERTCYHESCTAMIVHDEGEDELVRRTVRRARRHLTAGSAFSIGSFNNPFHALVDDPMPRKSQHSLFIQIADLVAYAGFRRIIAPGGAVSAVCPQSMWDELGTARHSAVNRLSGGPAGIVCRK